MTPAQTALCAMLFGGMIGSGSVVAVNKVSAKQETAKPKKDRGGTQASRPRVARPEPAPRPGPSILDCPTPVIGSPWGVEPYQPTGLTPPMSDALLPPHAVEQPGGGGFMLPPPSYSPAIPEPGTWAMMIAGFGLVGCAKRQRRVA